MSTALSVNLNKIALIRNSREGSNPDLIEHAQTCLDAGADGITVHPRPDQRHIRASDIAPLSALCKKNNVEFNIEGNPFAEELEDYPGFIDLVESVHPEQVTLVPDSNDQLTSDHGFDLTTASPKLQPLIQRFKQQGMRVSLFMDPDLEQITLAKEIGADRIEFYTGPYAELYKLQQECPSDTQQEQLAELFECYRAAAEHASNIGLELNAGHDLNLDNLQKFLTIPNIAEVSIGHALIVDAIAMGLTHTVKQYSKICQQSAAEV